MLWRLQQVHVARRDNLVLNALVLALMVDAHVSDGAKTQFGHLRELVSELFLRLLVTNQLVELEDGFSSEQSCNTSIAKSDVDKSFEQVDQVLCLFITDLLGVGVLDEADDHEFGDASLYEPLATVLVHSEAAEGPRGCLSHA